MSCQNTKTLAIQPYSVNHIKDNLDQAALRLLSGSQSIIRPPADGKIKVHFSCATLSDAEMCLHNH